jgi:hypothetical protein
VLRDRRLIGALILLLVAVGAWDVHKFRARKAPAGPAAPVAASHAENAQRPAGPPVLPWRPARATPVPVALPDGARNPFMTADEQFRGKFEARPAETMGKGSVPVHLEGISVRGDARVALIDGEPVREGGFVGDIQVVRVQDNEVTLARHGRVWRVVLPPIQAEPPAEARK